MKFAPQCGISVMVLLVPTSNLSSSVSTLARLGTMEVQTDAYPDAAQVNNVLVRKPQQLNSQLAGRRREEVP